MQSYEHHLVHESLRMRHPYIQEKITSEIDLNQVSTYFLFLTTICRSLWPCTTDPLKSLRMCLCNLTWPLTNAEMLLKL
jgi:hypothetical protein